MIDCCELALYNSQLVFKVVIGAFSVISLLLAMFFGYNLKLSSRTAKLEKKNGKDLKELDQLKAEVKVLKEKNA